MLNGNRKQQETMTLAYLDMNIIKCLRLLINICFSILIQSIFKILTLCNITKQTYIVTVNTIAKLM